MNADLHYAVGIGMLVFLGCGSFAIGMLGFVILRDLWRGH
jgi:hypothetical protein